LIFFDATIVDAATEALTVEITGDTGEIDTFLTMIEPYGLKEMTRTGVIALQRGNHDIQSDLNQ